MLIHYTLYPAVLAFIFITISATISSYQYAKLKFIELRDITIGWLLVAQLPLVYIIFYIFQSEELTEIRSIIAPIVLSLTIIGILVVWNSLFKLTNRSYRNKHVIMILFNFFSVGVMIVSYRISWQNDRWVNSWEPQWGIFFPILAMMWVNLELLVLFFNNYSTQDLTSRKSNFIMLVGWVLYFISPGIVIIERFVFQSDDTVIYFYFVGISLLMVSMGLYFHPLEVNISPTDYLYRSLEKIRHECKNNTISKLNPILNNVISYHKDRGDINGYFETLVFKAKFELSELNLKDLFRTMNELDFIKDEILNDSVSKNLFSEIDLIESKLISISKYLHDNAETDVQNAFGFQMGIHNSTFCQNANTDRKILKKLKLGDLLILIKLLKLYPTKVNIKEALNGFDHYSKSNLYNRVDFLVSADLVLLEDKLNSLDQKSRFIVISETGISLIKSIFQLIPVNPAIN